MSSLFHLKKFIQCKAVTTTRKTETTFSPKSCPPHSAPALQLVLCIGDILTLLSCSHDLFSAHCGTGFQPGFFLLSYSWKESLSCHLSQISGFLPSIRDLQENNFLFSDQLLTYYTKVLNVNTKYFNSMGMSQISSLCPSTNRRNVGS